MTRQPEDGNARRRLVQKLESLQRAGVTHLPKPKHRRPEEVPAAVRHSTATAALKAATSSPAANVEPAATPSSVPRSAAATTARSAAGTTVGMGTLFDSGAQRPLIAPEDRPAALAVIEKEVAGCTRCKELASTRTQTVFGVGNPGTRLCFMGEAPGADEDRQGEPFVGRAGQLLNKIIEACTLSREQVYILNTLKCRPPNNRVPADDEVANCREFLDRQLDVLRPEFICCLGAVAAQALLQTDQSIGRMRGKFFNYRGSRVMCTYHPAYLLRNPAAKKDTWDDMQMLMRAMGIELPKKA